MANLISIIYERPIEKLIEKLNVLLLNEDGYLKGDKTMGSFQVNSTIGLFKGTYQVKDKTINILLQKKPFFISSKLIEIEVKKYLDKN
ncbi:hypothetical protein [Flavobacterium sp. HJSW_4]|uniref:hypothetical protein n=1 Tax=Flavobacterium sp. HJSW_4 TaxID=3344660 RepID=UPI0035F272D2